MRRTLLVTLVLTHVATACFGAWLFTQSGGSWQMLAAVPITWAIVWGAIGASGAALGASRSRAVVRVGNVIAGASAIVGVPTALAVWWWAFAMMLRS
jgi:hypothetical protein